MKENNKKSYKVFYFLIIPLALLLGFLGLWQITSIYGGGLEYITEKAREDTLEIKVSGSGTIVAPEKKEIKSEITGTVEEILVSEGDIVEQGQELLKLKNDKLDADKAAQWAEYLRAVDDLEKIYANPDAPQSEKESGEANKESARLNHKLAESAVDKKTIKSPISGTIAKMNTRIGDSINITDRIIDNELELVNNNETSASLMTIIDLNKLEAQVAINEKDLPKVSRSQAATLHLDALDKNKSLNGAVNGIESIGNNNKGVVTYNVYVGIEDLEDNNIKPGMSVNALININRERNILLVSNDALKMEGERYYVDVLKNNIPRKRIIKTGLKNDKYTQVLDGLKAGEEVIVDTKETNMESNILKAIKNF